MIIATRKKMRGLKRKMSGEPVRPVCSRLRPLIGIGILTFYYEDFTMRIFVYGVLRRTSGQRPEEHPNDMIVL